MRALIITNLYPNRAEPGRGVFNRQQLEALPGDWQLEVIAPLPWTARVPGVPWPEAWRRILDVPAREAIGRLTVHHPRYLVVPKVGRRLSGRSLSWRLQPLVRRLHAAAPFDVILATWAYPDVLAAVLAAEPLGLPVVAKVHGSDVHLASRTPWRRRAIRWALERCAGVVAVSRSLKEELAGFGVPDDRIRVIPNGVDIERFRPMDRREARVQLSLPLEGRRIVFVGNLAPVKGLPVLLQALAALPADVTLSLVGDGPQRAALAGLIQRLDLDGRVRLIGRVPHAQVPVWMNAADLFCLPSASEGCPNVVVEALACGRPVVASRVGGIPELLQDARCGLMVPPRDPEALAAALQQALNASWDAAAIRRTVEDRGWAESARRLDAMLKAAANGTARGSGLRALGKRPEPRARSPEPRAPSPEPTGSFAAKTVHVLTVDLEFSTHPGDLGVVGRVGGEAFGVEKLSEICRRYGVSATFFVDVCNAQGERERLMRETGLRLREAGHDLELHTHPEWMLDPRRSRMCEYELPEQIRILAEARARFERWFGLAPVAYRAGDWSANDNTLAALREVGIPVDSSLFCGWPPCEITNPEGASNRPRTCGGMLELPPTVFKSRGPGLGYRLLSTDGQPYGEIAAVIRRLMAGQDPLLMSVYHSFSFLGWDRRRTRYWVERHDVRKFERFVEAIARDPRAEARTVRELYERYRREPAFLLERPKGVPESPMRFVVPRLMERASSRARGWVSP